MASITPVNGRAAFITAQDPHTYYELQDETDGTNYGRDTSSSDIAGLVSGDFSTQESYNGMDTQNDPPTNTWFDNAIVTDAAMLLYLPAGLGHGSAYGLFSNGGSTNGQGMTVRGTTTGVEIAAQHNNADQSQDGVVHEIPDADLPGWFAVSGQFNSHGGAEGDMALWINGVAEASGTRVFTLDHGSGDPDLGSQVINDLDAADILDGPTANGDWAGASPINGSGILIANFTCDNPGKVGAGTPGDTSPGAGDSFHTDFATEHTGGGSNLALPLGTLASGSALYEPTLALSAGVDPFEAEIYNGSAWVSATVEVYDGAVWVAVDVTLQL